MKNFRKLLLAATLMTIFSTFSFAGGYCPPPTNNCPPPPPPPTCSNSCNSGSSLLGTLQAQIALCLSLNLRLW